jgi:diguanylate cyclase (GGDEF)-like protein
MVTQLFPAPALSHTARILVIGTGVAGVRNARDILKTNPDYHVHGARSLETAVADIRAGKFDALVVEHRLWCGKGVELRRAVFDAGPIALVLLGGPPEEDGCSSPPSEHLAVFRYADPSDLSQLPELVAAAVGTARAFRRRETMTRWLEREAGTDPLTGLHNHRAFDAELREACASSANDGVGLIVTNVVGTGLVNHNYGQDAGDRMLRRAAAGIARSIRASDVAARLSGDNFAVILQEATIEVCRLVARRIAHQLERANANEWADDIPVALTFGVACGKNCSAEALYETARAQLNDQRRFMPALISKRGDHDDGPSVA